MFDIGYVQSEEFTGVSVEELEIFFKNVIVLTHIFSCIQHAASDLGSLTNNGDVH